MNHDFKIVILTIFDKNDFPNKAMADIHGKPMIQHVFESAEKSGASEVVIATDSTRIGMAAEDFGATVCMIVDDEFTGISRLASVVDKMAWGDDAVVVNLPADAPLTPSAIIQQVAENLITHEDADCAILYSLVSPEEAEKDYTVNLVLNQQNNVMYFSRRSLPHVVVATDETIQYKRTIELNAYRAGLLRNYRDLADSELETMEDIEELKLLFNGITIHADEAKASIGQRVIKESNVDKVKFLISPDR